jgi:plasmid stability protein
MAQLLIRDVDPAIVAHLKDRAKRNNRSLSAEVRMILERAAAVPFLSDDRLEALRLVAGPPRRKTLEERQAASDRLVALGERIRAEVGDKPQGQDSTEIIREFRGSLGS